MTSRLAHERGTTLIETLVLSFAVLAVTMPLLLIAVRFTEATDIATDEARAVALWFARHGEMPEGDRRSEIDVVVDGETVRVSSLLDVDLIGIGGSKIRTTVSAQFEMPISPYRSSR
ncbi:MAG: hypothetical protein DWP92_10295 [Armatimonadetes bacterium]|nr:MAG: hypothetical protein DWP92_10295 [Armatimonadota bacterium]